jgi:hypothetical protein
MAPIVSARVENSARARAFREQIEPKSGIVVRFDRIPGLTKRRQAADVYRLYQEIPKYLESVMALGTPFFGTEFV